MELRTACELHAKLLPAKIPGQSARNCYRQNQAQRLGRRMIFAAPYLRQARENFPRHCAIHHDFYPQSWRFFPRSFSSPAATSPMIFQGNICLKSRRSARCFQPQWLPGKQKNILKFLHRPPCLSFVQYNTACHPVLNRTGQPVTVARPYSPCEAKGQEELIQNPPPARKNRLTPTTKTPRH